MKMSCSKCCLLLLTLLCCSSFVFGGVCIHGTEYYVLKIEADPREDLKDLNLHHCFRCLRWERHTESNRWAGPVTAEYFRSKRESPLRDRIRSACLKYLDGPQTDKKERLIAHEAVRTLAHFGIGHVGDHDVFEILTSDDPSLPLVDLAALGDPRTVPVLKESYIDLKKSDLAADRIRKECITVLNCLYHISGNEAVQLAEFIVKIETDSLLIERAKRVVNRKVR